MKIFNSLIGILIIFLIIFNIGFFYFSLTLTDKIAYYENKIEEIHHENINLEKELSNLESLNFALKITKDFGFTNITEPIFLEKVNYAFLSNQ